MTPSYAVKKGIRYRYYVSAMVVQGRRSEAGSLPRVSAQAIETAVERAVAVLIAQGTGDDAGSAQPLPTIDR